MFSGSPFRRTEIFIQRDDCSAAQFSLRKIGHQSLFPGSSFVLPALIQRVHTQRLSAKQGAVVPLYGFCVFASLMWAYANIHSLLGFTSAFLSLVGYDLC